MNARFVDLTAHIQNQITQTFRAWGFTPPNGGIGQNQRAIAAGNWHGIAPANGVLATGGEGVVHVWCRVDPLTQRIQDRIVVKLVVAGDVRYGLPRNWANHNVGNGEPMECHLANLVQSGLGIADQQHVLSCLGWGDIEPNNRRYKLYFEYCQHSNLDGLMKIQPRRKKPGAARRGRKQFAEPFLWYLFESLAKACDAMDRTYPEGLVHQDLHPGNIFFGAADPNRFAMYPTPKVADFGSARRLTIPVVTRGLTVLDDPVLLEYAAPELSWNLAPPPVPLWEVPNMRISQKTNIYQIGLIMASAMRLLSPLPENNWRRPPRGYNVPPHQQLHHNPNSPIGVRELPTPRLNPGPKRYSAELTRIVWRCLRHNPDQRPSAAALLFLIRSHANFKGMDTAPLPVPAAMKDLCIDLNPDKYAINKRF